MTLKTRDLSSTHLSHKTRVENFLQNKRASKHHEEKPIENDQIFAKQTFHKQDL